MKRKIVGDRVRWGLPSCSMYVSFLSEWGGMPLQGFEWQSMWLVFRNITLEAIGEMGHLVGKLEVTRPVMKSWLRPSYRWPWFGQGQIFCYSSQSYLMVFSSSESCWQARSNFGSVKASEPAFSTLIPSCTPWASVGAHHSLFLIGRGCSLPHVIWIQQGHLFIERLELET